MASSISKELQEFVKGKLGWVATANQEAYILTPSGLAPVIYEQGSELEL